MNTKQLTIDYTGSGIKTLRFWAWTSFICCCLAFGACLIFSIHPDTHGERLNFLLTGLIAFLSGFMSLGIMLSLASIADSLLYQKTYFSNQFEKEKENSASNTQENSEKA